MRIGAHSGAEDLMYQSVALYRQAQQECMRRDRDQYQQKDVSVGRRGVQRVEGTTGEKELSTC